MKSLTLSTLICAVLIILPIANSSASSKKNPNIIFLMADDMGYGDLQSYNSKSKINTPHLARLAKEGRRFTDAHSPASVCVPTRYGLMTGRYPFRMKSSRGGPLLEPNRLTLPSVLRNAGYKTAMIGKWHLGVENEKNPKTNQQLSGGPFDHGFESFYGIPASLDIPPYYWIKNDRPVSPPSEKIGDNNTLGWTRIQGAFWRGGGIAPGYKHIDVLPIIRDKSVEFIENATKSEKPFFLYTALPAPHTPWLPTKRFEGKSSVKDYGDFVIMVDDVVGSLLTALDKTKSTNNTLFIFTSDNGPVWYPQDTEKYRHSSVGPLRGMKGDAWEGGHRMPFIARWPDNIPPNSESSQIICHTDMISTVAALTGQKLPANAGEDSYNLLPALLGEKFKPIREATVHQSSRRYLAIRQGQWKLIPGLGSGGFSKPSTVKPKKNGIKGQLYNLKNDIGEKNNLYANYPNVVKQLTLLLEKYKSEGRSTPEN
jgi:arylsulfatase A-like enzyme